MSVAALKIVNPVRAPLFVPDVIQATPFSMMLIPVSFFVLLASVLAVHALEANPLHVWPAELDSTLLDLLAQPALKIALNAQLLPV